MPLLLGWRLMLLPVHVMFLERIINPAWSLVFEGEREKPNGPDRHGQRARGHSSDDDPVRFWLRTVAARHRLSGRQQYPRLSTLSTHAKRPVGEKHPRAACQEGASVRFGGAFSSQLMAMSATQLTANS